MATRDAGLRPQGAVIRPHELVYKPLSLLGISYDIRLLLWQYLTTLQRSNQITLTAKPVSEFGALFLTCRQVYHEIDAGRQFLLPWNRIPKLLLRVPNEKTIYQYRSLTLEIPQNGSAVYFRQLCRFLQKSHSTLRELRVHFYGCDAYGTEIHTHGCGNLEDGIGEKRLPIDGQRFEKLLWLWITIMSLEMLEVLTISNANLQAYQYMFLAKKPHLQYLSISADPRSTIHQQHKDAELGPLLLVPPKDTYPPVKALNITANAVIGSVQVAIKVMETLEHLTWTMPDSSLSAGGMRTDWYVVTGELMSALRLRSSRLKTLRLCIAGAGIYEESAEYASMMGPLIRNLPFLSDLRHFEFHGKMRSFWYGREMIQSLPNGLNRLYLSDFVISPYDLLSVIHLNVLRAEEPLLRSRLAARRRVAFNPPTSRRKVIDESADIADLLPANQGPWLIKLDPLSYEVEDLSPDCEMVGEFRTLVERQEGNESDNGHVSYEENGMIGEGLDRRDYIPFHTMKLRFLHYEYNRSELPTTGYCSFTPWQVVLFINGRLLDRTRNKHLIQYDRAKCIRPTPKDFSIQSHDDETATRCPSDLGYAVLLYNLYEIERDRPRDIKAALAELKASPFTDDNSYFGLEDEAERVFDSEPVARAEDLEPIAYIVEKDILVDGKCHWASPDAVIPPIE